MTPRSLLLSFAALALLLIPSALRAQDNWPQFRGPTGLGYTQEKDLPLTWGGKDQQNVLWKAPLKGQGHASPIVWGDRVFVSTAIWAPEVTGKQRETVIPEHHLTCYQVSDGKVLWDTLIPPGPWVRKDFRSGPAGGYAAPTPTTDGKLVFIAYGSSVLAAVDFAGKIAWRKEIVPFTHDVTLGGSPVLFGDTVLLFCPAAEKKDSRLTAFATADGAVKWEQKFPDMGFGHSTPVIIDVNGKPQLLVLASGMSEAPKALRSLDPVTGNVLWWCRGAGDASSPAYGSGVVFFDSGRGSLAVAVDPTGSGDVSKTNIKWTIDAVPEGISSPVIVGPHVYQLFTGGVLSCVDLATGKPVYKKKLDGLSTPWASPIVDPAGRIFYANAGKSYVIQAGAEFKVLATNDLGDGNHPSPAVAGGKLFLVGMKELFCVGSKR